MENVTETKPLGLRWRHLTAAARIPQFFRSANTWDKEVSLSEREKCAVHGRSGKMFSGWIESFSASVIKTFSILHYIINAGLTRHTGVSTTPSHLGIRRDTNNLHVLLSFGTVRSWGSTTLPAILFFVLFFVLHIYSGQGRGSSACPYLTILKLKSKPGESTI